MQNWTSGSSGTMNFIVNAGIQNSLSIDSNVVSNNTINSTGAIDVINASSTSIINVRNNTIQNITRSFAGANGEMGIYINSGSPYGGTFTFTNNNINNINNNNSTGACFAVMSSTTSGQTQNISNNVFHHFTSGIGTVYGISVSYQNVVNIYSNDMYSFSGAGNVYAIYCGYYNQTYNVYSNNIYSLSSTGTSSSIEGISIGNGGSTTGNIYKNKLYDFSESGTNGVVYGIHYLGGTITYTYNNYFSDLRTPASTNSSAVNGLYYAAGGSHYAFYNTIYINASSTSITTFGTSGIYTSTTPTLDLRNNIVINTSTAVGTSVTAAFRRSSTTLSTYSSASNNNDFYAGTPGVKNLIYYDGTNSEAYITDFKSRVTPRDASTFTENPNFVDASGHDFHINSAIPTQLEGGGIKITSPVSITTDYDGDTRNTSTPDVGADEFTGTRVEYIPPSISYTAPGNTLTYTERTITAAITDESGVSTSGIGLPVIYWRINSGTWNSSQGTYVSGNDYTFTFGSGVTGGDTVKYYIAAQDMSPAKNVNLSPLSWASGFTSDPPACSTPPTVPASYLVIAPPLNGNYTVGSGGNYSTITTAVNDLNLRGVNGPVQFLLTDASYTNETLPITFDLTSTFLPNVTNTVTIKPYSGTRPTISGSNNSCIFLWNGADYISIDGSNRVGGISRDLTMTNTSLTDTAVIMVKSKGANAGATHNSISNCNIKNGYITSGSYDFYITGNDNDKLSIINNSIFKAYVGIYVNASSATYLDDSLTINGNDIGSATASDYIGHDGVIIYYSSFANISQNTIYNIIVNNSSPVGMSLNAGVVSSSVTRNNIHDIRAVSTNGYGGKGMYINTGLNSSSLTVANNMVSSIGGDGFTSFFNSSPVGIFFDGAMGGVNIYNNSVYMSGTLTYNNSTKTAAILFNSASLSTVDMRNNIFSNTMTNTSNTGAKNYAIYCSASSSAFTYMDNNDYYVSGAQGILGYYSGDKINLSNWKTGTGKDASSISGDPKFTSTTNLHILVDGLSPVSGAGINLSAVTTDFDGDIRNNPPDLGADEFFMAPLLNLTALIEGFYNGTSNVPDTITVEMRSGSSPYRLMASKKMVLNESGTGSMGISVATEVDYYIVLKHRNAIETWSATPQFFVSDTMTYDFTTAQNKAYGGNMVQVGTKWCLYGGDVNQDGVVDGADLANVDNDATLWATGYLATDINGDGVVDGADLATVDNNATNWISVQTPSIFNLKTRPLNYKVNHAK